MPRASSSKPSAKASPAKSPSKGRVSAIAGASQAVSPSTGVNMSLPPSARASGVASNSNSTTARPSLATAATARPSFAGGVAAVPPKPEEPKYAPPQPSFLAEWLWFPFYDHFVQYYPKSWTPNGITLFGIFATLMASFILLAGMPTMIKPLGAPYVSQYDTAAVPAASQEAALAFLASSGIEISSSSSEDINNKYTAVTATFIDGLRSRNSAITLAKQTAANAGKDCKAKSANAIYGKNIKIVPEAVARVAAEAVELVTTGTIAPSAGNTPAKGLLGKANEYDFHRPQPFYQSLQNPIARIEIAVTMVYKAVVESILTNVVVGVFGCDALATTIRNFLAAYVEAPIAAFGCKTLTGCGCLAKFIPAAILATPGRLMLIIAGFLNLVYCVADNTDGRHARRTKQSSFVGEYLDHGLDCVTSLLTTYLLACALGIEGPQAAVAVFAVAFVTVLSHLVNQEKGFMIWGNRAFTVDEAMLAFGFGMIIVGVAPGFVTGLVPVELIAAAGVPTQWIPTALAHARVGEFLWFGFLASQVSVAATLLNIDRTVIFRPSALAVAANIAAIWYLTTMVGQPTALRSEALATAVGPIEIPANAPSPCAMCAFVTTAVANTLALVPAGLFAILQAVDTALNVVFAFEAQSAILAACTCSLVIHAPIFAKCYKVHYGTDNTAFVITLPIAIFTFFFVSSGFGALIAVIGHAVQVRVNVNKLNARGAALKKQK